MDLATWLIYLKKKKKKANAQVPKYPYERPLPALLAHT